MTINCFDDNFVDLCDEEGDPEEDVDVREDAALEVVHDALVQLWPHSTSNFMAPLIIS